MVESGGLENRCTRKGTVGSNPTLSANRLRILDCGLRILNLLNPQSEFRNPQFSRRGAGVAELAALEMLCTGNCTVGSNPTLSASRLRISDCGLRIPVFFNPQSAVRNPQFLSGSGRRAIARLQTPPGRERSNGSGPRMCRGLSGA